MFDEYFVKYPLKNAKKTTSIALPYCELHSAFFSTLTKTKRIQANV